jgi:HSP20 family molecular chaperone IbpA
MAFFQRTGDFAPLFRLLDDYDIHRSTRGDASLRGFAPKFDVRDTSDAYLLDGELPGIAQKDIDIEFSDTQTLVIKGRSEREYHSPEAGETAMQKAGDKDKDKDKDRHKQVSKETTARHKYWVSERSVGEFHRSFNFPTLVDQDGVKANLKNGILSIVVPKAAPPVSKKIAIQ